MPKPQSTATVAAPKGETINPFDLESLLAGYDDTSAAGPKKAAPKPAPVAAEDDDEDDEKPATPAKKTYQHHAKTIRMGLRAGLTEEEMAGMELEDLADEIIDRNETARHRAEGAAQAAKTPPRSPEADIERSPEADFGGAKLDHVDDEIVKVLKHMAARIASLEAGTNEVKQTIRERDTRGADARLDELFKANPAHFGDKSFAKTPRASKEMAKRKAVVSHLNALTKDEVLGLDRDFAAACEALGYAAPAEVEEDDDEAQEWAQAGLAKPNGRQAAPKPKGVARATDAVSKVMERAGISVGGNGTVSLDDFAD